MPYVLAARLQFKLLVNDLGAAVYEKWTHWSLELT